MDKKYFNRDINNDVPEEKKPATVNEKTNETTEVKGALEHPNYEELEAKLTEIENKAAEHWNQLLRSQAELDNIRRRAERDVANAHKYALEKFALELLPVIDSLERGLEKSSDELEPIKAMREGITLTIDLLLKTLAKFGIRQLNPQGETFNPELHQAVSTQEQSGAKHNTVSHVLQKGYLLQDRLLRPALVVVVK
ncbi:MAG: nucleotide exchange factor GrpE [Gammaproteobacteria bacterium]